MTHMTKAVTVGLMLVAFAARAQEPELPFSKIELWQSRDKVIAVMGRPNSETNSVTLGVPHSKLRWIGTAGQTFAVFLVGSRVVAMRACAGSNDC